MLTTLNPEQRKAVTATKGRVLVLAGAGTGKTLVLTTRIAYLIHRCQVDPKNILGLTFTNKAAEEMRQRIATLVDRETAKQITLCTFHSLCMQILRKEIHHLGYTKNFTLYSPGDVEQLVKSLARDLLERDSDLPSLASTMALITQARNCGLGPDEIGDPSSQWHDGFVKSLYKRLLESMRAHNALDFDHLLLLTVELFSKHPAVLRKYQDKYRYILIDEYQDTNPVQFQIASLLSKGHQNLCVVGDDDQSIYGWRGADIQNILHFDNAITVKLEQNYRSTPTILQAANRVIENNQSRHKKSLWSKGHSGEPIHIFHAPSEKEEAEAVILRIKQYKRSFQLHWKDFAILYRSNALSRPLEKALLNSSWQDGDRWIKGIPYRVFGGLEFFERREVKDLFSYLRAIVNPKDQAAILRVINQPRRGIGSRTLDALTAYHRSHHLDLWPLLLAVKDGTFTHESITPRSNAGIAQFVSLIEEAKTRCANGTLTEAITWLVDASDYRRAIKEDVKSQKMQAFKWENVQELISAVADYEKEKGDDASLADFVLTSPLGQNEQAQKEKHTQHDDHVQLMTFHSAKGLEFPVCFLIGLESHIIPHEKSVQETGVEEERRLLYVAMTRAKQHLILSMAKKRLRMGKEAASRPSPFLSEIPKELLHITHWHS